MHEKQRSFTDDTAAILCEHTGTLHACDEMLVLPTPLPDDINEHDLVLVSHAHAASLKHAT